jgi:hypothetical protein
MAGPSTRFDAMMKRSQMFAQRALESAETPEQQAQAQAVLDACPDDLGD